MCAIYIHIWMLMCKIHPTKRQIYDWSTWKTIFFWRECHLCTYHRMCIVLDVYIRVPSCVSASLFTLKETHLTFIQKVSYQVAFCKETRSEVVSSHLHVPGIGTVCLVWADSQPILSGHSQKACHIYLDENIRRKKWL